jgi:cell division protein FtsI/penicillin-binding protein 2
VQRQEDARTAPVDLRRALTSLGRLLLQAGREPVPARRRAAAEWSRRLSLDRKTGIDLPGEEGGTIPGRKWRARSTEAESACRKKKKVDQCYYPEVRPYNVGDNVNLSVGQGEISASPLQMATAYSTIVNDGKVPKPHLGLEVQDATGRLVQKIDPGTRRRVKIQKDWQQAIMDGLAGAAQREGGTSVGVFAGWPARAPAGYGKTGHRGDLRRGRPVRPVVVRRLRPAPVQADRHRGTGRARRLRRRAGRAPRAAHARQWFDLDPKLGRPSAGASVRQAAD